MNRRDALKSAALILGGTIIGGNAFLSGCTNKNSTFSLRSDDLVFLNDFGEAILPATDTPGAKEANVAEFMHTIVKDFYTTEEQATFIDGIKQVNVMADKKYNKDFSGLSATGKNETLSILEKEAKMYYAAKKEGHHYYVMFRQLTIWAYMSSEIVAQKAFIHMPLIEKYVGEIDYKPGDKIIYNDYHSGSAWGPAIHNIENS